MMAVIVVMFVIVLERPRASDVDTETEERDRNRLLKIIDRCRASQSQQPFPSNEERDQSKDYRARESSKVAHSGLGNAKKDLC
jgi:hypothetical protein